MTDTRLALATADEFVAFPGDVFLGQSRRQVAGPGGVLVDGQTCIWDAFPFVRYLNWPFALSGQIRFGPGTPRLVETIVKSLP